MALDLYDEEIAKLAEVYARLNDLCRHTRNTQENLAELGKRIADEFNKAGFLVNVDMTPAAILDHRGRGGSPLVEVIGRVSDPYNDTQFDHDKKRAAVLKSRERGEKYLGVKELPKGE